MGDMFSIPEVAKHLPQWGPVLKSVPASQRLNVYLHPWHLSLGEGAKAGRYPSMHQTKAHMPSVVWKTIRLPGKRWKSNVTSLRGDQLEYFSVRYIDGHNKGVMVQSVLALVVYTDACLISFI